MSDDSCLVQKLGYYTGLSESDKDLLATLEENELELAEGETAFSEHDRENRLFVVKTGWLGDYGGRRGGERIFQFFLPGDIIGFRNLPYESTISTVKALTTCCLCPFPAEHLETVFRRSLNLTRLFFNLNLMEHVVLLERLKAIGQMSASEKLAHMLLSIHDRLSINNPGLKDSFNFPPKQQDVAAALGVTPVTVSRSKAELQSEKLIRWYSGRVELLDLERLKEHAEFTPRYAIRPLNELGSQTG